jgi:inorganic phosphate transporter, PiT family
MLSLAASLLLAVALAFAWSMGAHYTGACMGMAYAARAVSVRQALLLMAPLTLLGAVLASEAVERTVGAGLLSAPIVSVPTGLAIVASAFALTTAYNLLRLPTSTIQILVFAVAGAGVAAGTGVEWATIGRLVVVWAMVPPLAAALGYVLTRATAGGAAGRSLSTVSAGALAGALVAAGAGASFVMGANDVSNATGALLMTNLFDARTAALLGGIGLALGVLTWGRPLLQRVAFETVDLDRRSASIAQLVQASLVCIAVLFGYFTSLNQALVGAMAGTGLARGRATLRRKVLRGILIGWAVGPASGFAAAYAVLVGLRTVGIPF